MEPIKRYTPRIRTNEFGLRWVEFIEESEGDMAFYADHEAKVRELEERLTTLEQQRIKYGPICLVCGAAEPCHLKDDPHSPCTFDPAPRELWDRCKEQKQRISELEERLKDRDAEIEELTRTVARIRTEEIKPMNERHEQLEKQKADLEAKLRQVAQWVERESCGASLPSDPVEAIILVADERGKQVDRLNEKLRQVEEERDE